MIKKMNKTFVFHIPPVSKEKADVVQVFNLKKVLQNERTKIYQNEEMRLCIDKKVIRVLIFDEGNKELEERLQEYFYDEELSKI